MRLAPALFASLFALLLITPAMPVRAQEQAYIQIEAQPTLAEANVRASDYSALLQQVNGYRLLSGWYAITLGPFDRAEAEQRLSELRAAGQIPRDSFVALPNRFGARFWPEAGAAPVTASPVDESPSLIVTPAPAEIDETPREARASEAQLNRDEKRRLQELLQWAGTYSGAIDGLFGRGTRSAMAAWQQRNGYDATGVLTTRQRAELLAQYNAILDGLGMAVVRDTAAGIEVEIPTEAVRFARLEPPFAHYDPTGVVPDARVLLISQTGDVATLFGLYDIMQTLEIVPLNGPRERQRTEFTLIGQDSRIVSHTEARLEDGQVKGFVLIWPRGDEERRARVLEAMQTSFTRFGDALDPAAGGAGEQRIDLVSGLQVRQPRLSRSGFFIDASGNVITTADVAQGCSRITLEGDIEATAIAVDNALGIAVLQPNETLKPQSIAGLRSGPPRLQSEVAVAGYSFGGVLGAPTLTFGTLADVRGLSGEEELDRLMLAALPGDAGGPVFDARGAVLGMLLPSPASGARKLPEGVSFSADAKGIASVAEASGLQIQPADSAGSVGPEDLTQLAGQITVLVRCWD